MRVGEDGRERASEQEVEEGSVKLTHILGDEREKSMEYPGQNEEMWEQRRETERSHNSDEIPHMKTWDSQGSFLAKAHFGKSGRRVFVVTKRLFAVGYEVYDKG